jgi:protein O-GlcNAc transferase
VFAPPATADEHLSRLRLADIALDTLPFSSAAAGDALWAGVPVVTCKGNAFSARIGASLATAIGQSDLIAPDLDTYEAFAWRLASHPERLAECKRHLAGARTPSPRFDADRFRRHLEAAYTRMYVLARSGTPPQSFAVTAE